MANATILHEVRREHENGWSLCLQWCRYNYDGGGKEHGYRFIWRRPNGKLQPGRMQARLPSVEDAMELIEAARKDGWGEETAEDAGKWVADATPATNLGPGRAD